MLSLLVSPLFRLSLLEPRPQMLVDVTIESLWGYKILINSCLPLGFYSSYSITYLWFLQESAAPHFKFEQVEVDEHSKHYYDSFRFNYGSLGMYKSKLNIATMISCLGYDKEARLIF